MVSPVPAITAGVNSMTIHGVGVPGITADRREIAEEPVARVIEDKIYVAVGLDVDKYKSVLLWALQHSGGKKFALSTFTSRLR